LALKWKAFLRFYFPKVNIVISEKTRICSNHFQPSDFTPDIRSLVLGKVAKHVLTEGAVPTVKDKTDIKPICSAAKNRAARAKKKERKEFVQNLLSNSATKVTVSDGSSIQSARNKESLPSVPDQIEDDGVEYLSGYVAWKLRQKYPELGNKTRTLAAALGPMEDHQMLLKPTFVEALSYHGLTKPSPNWLRATKKIHKLFDKYHPENGFKTGKFLIKRLVNKIISKNPSYCEPGVKLYIRQRLLARIKKFNRKLALKPPTNQKKTPVQKKLVKLGATINQI